MASDRINDKFYIIYAENYDNFRYYISNTNPIIWTQDINCSKRYIASKSAEFDIVGDYYNYRDIRKQMDNGNVNRMYVGEYDTNLNEIRRVNIL